MSTMTLIAPSVKSTTTTRAFGEGIVDTPRALTPIEKKRAEVFGLRTTATSAPSVTPRPVVKVAPVKPAPTKPVKLERGEREVRDDRRQAFTRKPAVVAPSDPSIDEAWNLGYTLGRNGVKAAPRRFWADEVKAAFIEGFETGAERLAGLMEEQEEVFHATAREWQERDLYNS